MVVSMLLGTYPLPAQTPPVSKGELCAKQSFSVVLEHQMLSQNYSDSTRSRYL
jgi:hypothetical protein